MSGFKPFIQGVYKVCLAHIDNTPIDDTQSGMPPLTPISKNAKIFTPRIISSGGIKKPKPTYKRNMCEHDRIKDDCKFCIGKNICEHGRIKRRCGLCGVGPSLCVHKRQKIQCVQCKGTGICEHGKRKNTCRDCEGVSFCLHNKYPHTCIPCGGKYLCEHNKIRIKCKQCEEVIALKELHTHDTS